MNTLTKIENEVKNLLKSFKANETAYTSCIKDFKQVSTDWQEIEDF